MPDPYARAQRPAGDPWAAPQRGAGTLTGLARALQVLLLVQLVALVAELVTVLRQRSIVEQISAGVSPVSPAQAAQADDAAQAAGAVTQLLYVATAVLPAVLVVRRLTATQQQRLLRD